ncbi:hypothetical protein [Gluconacetobacter entanii]|uniref:Uncharacterized protein n=1 Tax=Gluconacetobacter entanii TaxID=108528 RepID=A0A318Q8S3_9PROT|nr:hypothetical protein [Gluconacetobacter entanii]MCE2578080.1 hypothetical protein [Komagataeibacter sp. FNDCR1]PYD61997.1 hypothetical protein CFR72_13605 [Gluconacetobacter entanii]
MARIRSVHPGLWTDETFVSVSPLARLFLIGLWNEADDNGIFPWKPLKLKMRLLPADNGDAAALLAELERIGAIMRYEADGDTYGAVRNFRKFQRPERPKPVHPITAEVEQFVALATKSHTCSRKKTGPVGGKAPRGSRSVDDGSQGQHQAIDVQTPNEHRQGIETQGPMERYKIPPIIPLPGDELFDDSEKPSTPKPKTRRAVRPEPDEAAFEQFWQAYPRKVGKPKARRAFAKAVGKASLETLLAAIAATAWPSDPTYIPHPATWLNNERWADEGVLAASDPGYVRTHDEDAYRGALREWARNGYDGLSPRPEHFPLTEAAHG